MPSERTIDRLKDMLEDARRVERFTDGMSLPDFMANEQTGLAVERLLRNADGPAR